MRTLLAPAMALVASTAGAGHEFEGRDIENGRILYDQHCSSCHGVNLEGQPDWQLPGDDGTLSAPPHDRTGHTWHHDNLLLFSYTQLGGHDALEGRGVIGFNSGMPGFADSLTDEQIWDTLAYIRSTWPEEVQDIQASTNPPHD